MPTVSTFNRKRVNLNKLRRIKLKDRKKSALRRIPKTVVKLPKKDKKRAMQIEKNLASAAVPKSQPAAPVAMTK